MTVNKNNMHSVAETIQFAKDLGAKDISVSTVRPSGRGLDDVNFLSHDDQQFVITQALNSDCGDERFTVLASDVLSFLYYDKISEDYICDPQNARSCSFGAHTLHVRTNGDVLACTACDIPLGNIANQKESFLVEVWEQHPLLNKVRSKNYLTGQCGSCRYKNFCGGCRCRAYSLTGDLFGDDLYCPLITEPNSNLNFE